MESQKLLSSTNNRSNDNISSGEEDWTDGSSYSSYSGSDSTIPDWELSIDDFTGELLYIQCHPFVVQNNKDVKIPELNEPFRKDQLRRSTRGKFLRLIRKRESKRRNKKQPKSVDTNESVSKVKFQDFQEGEEKDVLLDIDAENRYNLSSDKSLAESLLGLIVDTLSDGNRVMIAGFSYDSKAKHERNIKIGDWLKSINSIEVNVLNLDDVLQKFINKTNVLLKLQRVAGVDVTKNPPINELNNESDFVKELLSSKIDDEQNYFSVLCKYPVGVLYLNVDKLSENNQENEDVCYCIPRPLQKSILCKSRGMYVTLNHLLNDVTKTKPRITTIKYKGQLAHVVYTNFGSNLFLLMLPDEHVTSHEILLINDEIIRVVEFTYGSLEKCFTIEHNVAQIDLCFARFFARILSDDKWWTVRHFLESEASVSAQGLKSRRYHFEDIVPAVATLVLPDEAQMQIDDALAELEASDYRDWDLTNSSKKNEVTSILKRRSIDHHQNNVTQYSSNNSLQDDSYDGQSEESGSQGGYSEVSDDSRRNLRRSKYDSNEEDSEGDDYGDESQISGSSFDISEIRQSLLTETEDYRPVQLTSGTENVLYHFIQLDATEGILLCPAETKSTSQTYEFILNNFRQCCQKIHTLFQNTLRFKNMPAQDISKSVINKSIVAIKEYGLVFNSPYFGDNKKSRISYCVVGRIFHMPHPREAYVCYHTSVPQNIVEIAFKMNMATIT